MTETHKIIDGIPPPIMEVFFILRQNTRNAKNVRQISNENWKTVKYRIETISNRTPFFGQIFPMIIKLATSLHDFRLNIKN